MKSTIGIYAISGSMMSAPYTNPAIAEDLTTNATGTVVQMIPSTSSLITLGNEVVSKNAYLRYLTRSDGSAVLDRNGNRITVPDYIDDFAFNYVYLVKVPADGDQYYDPSLYTRELSTAMTASSPTSGVDASYSVKEWLFSHRTYGISSNRSESSYAVLSVITGSLANSIGTVAPSWFLSNSFGTPYVPDSSMSLGNVVPEEIDAAASEQLYRQTVGQVTLIPNANTINDFLNREGYTKTTEQLWQEAINSGS